MNASYGVSAWPNVREVSEKMDRLVNMPLLPIREEAMARYLDYFDRKCAGSRRMIEEAKQYIPGGVQHNLAFNYPFPLVIDRAEGAYLYDIDGNRYIDYLQAGGPTLLGSNYGPVNEKVWETVRHSGPVTGLFHEYEMKLARLIQTCVPSVELYRCLASGTEADMVAIRIARTFTGKESVVKIGGAYHGWSDQLVYSLHIPYTKTYEAHGIPAAVSGATGEAFPNRIDSLRRVLEENEAHGGTAAVVVEPFGPESGTRLVDRDYNAQVRALCDEFGALLIFDEVVTAFRAGPGGAQGYLGVKPDLTVFGKIVAGGYPMAGGDNGDKLREGLQGLIDKYELPFVVWNLGSIVHFEVSGVMYLDAKDPDIFRKIPERQKYIEQFGAALTANGVITLAGSRIYTSMADSDDTIAQTLAAFEDVFQNIEG